MIIVNYLHTIVISGYYEKEQWQSWADKIILNNENVQSWIYDVAVAKNKQELFDAIAFERRIEEFSKDTLYWETDVVIGYYYLMYKEDKITLSQLVEKVTDEDDASGESRLFDSKEMMDVINNVKIGRVDLKKIEKFLEPLAQEARKQEDVLKNYK